jgi:hypothetical protein
MKRSCVLSLVAMVASALLPSSVTAQGVNFRDLALPDGTGRTDISVAPQPPQPSAAPSTGAVLVAPPYLIPDARSGLNWPPPGPSTPCAPACADHQPAPFTPFMLGDFVGPLANLFSAVKIAENESPRPVDRVYSSFNYYNNLNKSRWTDPTQPIHNVALYRSTFGLEKTFLNQSMSLGLRIPFNTIDAQGKEFHLVPDPVTGSLVPSGSDEGFTTTLFGNISAIVKAVVWEDRESGSLLSGGATLSFPTASNVKIDPGMSTVAFMQPFGGFILNSGDLFIQGFSSLTVPLVSAQSIVLFNDIGVGYWLYRGGSGLFNGVAPTLELHLATPLRQIDPTSAEFGAVDGLRVFDVLDLTMGTTFLLSSGSTLGVGAVIPLTGPKPFDFEALVQFNYRF